MAKKKTTKKKTAKKKVGKKVTKKPATNQGELSFGAPGGKKKAPAKKTAPKKKVAASKPAATATKNKIKWQPEILAAGGTDTASLQRLVPGGSIAGAISVPTRYIHQPIETAHKQDIAGAIRLLTACVCDLDQHDWSF